MAITPDGVTTTSCAGICEDAQVEGWAARELGHAEPFSLVPEDWRWWLGNVRGHAPSIA
jgi:hypothetical protein